MAISPYFLFSIFCINKTLLIDKIFEKLKHTTQYSQISKLLTEETIFHCFYLEFFFKHDDYAFMKNLDKNIFL